MRLAFVDPIDWDYTVQTVYERPLGGTQSALSYLATSLARRGHELFVFNNTTTPGRYRNVQCLSIRSITSAFLESLELDAIVTVNSAELALRMRSYLGVCPKLALWNQHATNEPAVRRLAEPAVRDAHDAFVFVSQWQLDQYATHFGISPQQSTVLRNAIAPSFQNLFSPGERIADSKSHAPILAYTSTPFRGLDVLLRVFPEIRRADPQVTLKVFSSMSVYQLSSWEDERQFGGLYEACRNMEGVEYVGGISQPQLARQLRSVNTLAYPNTFAETSCIAVMEAMAAGCQVVTSDLGALPETAAGFATLVSPPGDRVTYQRNFRDACVESLALPPAQSRDAEREDHLQRQVAFANESLNWERRAGEWETWLSALE